MGERWSIGRCRIGNAVRHGLVVAQPSGNGQRASRLRAEVHFAKLIDVLEDGRELARDSIELRRIGLQMRELRDALNFGRVNLHEGKQKAEGRNGYRSLATSWSGSCLLLSSSFLTLPQPYGGKYLLVRRESSCFVFRVDLLAVHEDIEDAIPAFDELTLDLKLTLNLSRQTGGPGKVVSNDAVFDSNVHSLSDDTARTRIAVMLS